MNKPQLTDNPKLQDTHHDRFIMVVPSKVFLDRMTVMQSLCQLKRGSEGIASLRVLMIYVTLEKIIEGKIAAAVNM